MRPPIVLIAPVLLLTACASPAEPEAEASPDSQECLGLAQQASGYRGQPKRARARIQRRHDYRWDAFQREYERCMRARGHEVESVTPSP